MRTIAVTKADISKGPLILVNAENPYISGGRERLVPLDDDDGVILDMTAASLLRLLFRAIGSGGRIIPVSGYRSRRDQERIYVNTLLQKGRAFTEKFVASPGCSEHQSGLAVDLAERSLYIDPISPHFPYDGICGDFRNHAAKYGFVERYGAGKESLTGISPEPWHFRYVGYPHSLIMREYDLCLEEYIALLRSYRPDGEHLCFGQTEIFYADAESAGVSLSLPDECFQISGNNVDGFIVTVWRRGL